MSVIFASFALSRNPFVDFGIGRISLILSTPVFLDIGREAESLRVHAILSTPDSDNLDILSKFELENSIPVYIKHKLIVIHTCTAAAPNWAEGDRRWCSCSK